MSASSRRPSSSSRHATTAPKPSHPYATRTLNSIVDTYPTVRKLFHDRGYTLAPDMAAPRITAADIERQHRRYEATDVLFVVHDGTGERLAVIYPPDTRPRAEPVRGYRDYLARHGIPRCLIVTEQNVMNRKLLDAMTATGCRVDIEIFSRLAYPIVLRCDVPRHIALTPDQTADVLAPIGGQASALPRIPLSDPVVRAADLDVGQVVAVLRPQEPMLRCVSAY
jgi:DNA-directed RNA polymerase subunit H (RpoH/RPB5)